MNKNMNSIDDLKIIKLIGLEDNNIKEYPFKDNYNKTNPNLYTLCAIDYQYGGNGISDMLLFLPNENNNDGDGTIFHYPSYLRTYSMTCEFSTTNGPNNVSVLNKDSLDNVYDDGFKYQIFDRGSLTVSSEFGDFYDTVNTQGENLVVDYYGKYEINETDDDETFSEISAITKISEGMFSGCTDLTVVKLPYSTNYTDGGGGLNIGNSAFTDCTSLQCFYNYKTLGSVGDYAFYNCTSLSGNEVSCGPYSNLTKGDDNEFEFENGDIEVLKVNFDCGEGAFANCSSLRYIAFNDNREITLSGACFSGCSGLQYIEIPSNVIFDCQTSQSSESHGENEKMAQFADCVGLNGKTLRMYGENRKIPYKCFFNCGLLPGGSSKCINNLEDIGDSAFEGCKNNIRDNTITFGVTPWDSDVETAAKDFLSFYVREDEYDINDVKRIFGYPISD